MTPCLQENAKEVMLQLYMSLVKTRTRISCLLLVPALQSDCQYSMIYRKDCVNNKNKTNQQQKNLKNNNNNFDKNCSKTISAENKEA